MKKHIAIAIAVTLNALPVSARQDPLPVRTVVEDFLRVQTQGLPGAASFTVRDVEAANNLAPCSALEAFLPAGARAWGKTAVGVRCRAEAGWSIFIPVQIRVVNDYLIAARALAPGQLIGSGDLATRSGDLAQLPPGVLADAAQAVGRTLSVGLIAGAPVRSDSLRAVMAIQQGQSVKVVVRGQGFQVSTEGRALNQATAGQIARVRTATGQTISGLARTDGVVEIGGPR